MADDKLRIVATVEDQFTGPLSKLEKGLKHVGEETAKQGATWKKDWAGVREEVGKFQGVLRGFDPIFAAVGVTGFGAAMSITGMVTALKGFSGQTRDLSQMGRQIGMTVDQLRTLGSLGEKFGVSADAMRGAIGQFATNMVDLRQRWGQVYGELKNMNLGSLAEELVSAPTMEAGIEAVMKTLQNMPDSMKAARLSTLVFGTPDIAAVARSINGPIRDALKQTQADIGHLDKETEEAARHFEEHFSRIGRAAEKAKLNLLGPALKNVAGALDQMDAAAADPEGEQLKRLKESRQSADTAVKAAPYGTGWYFERQRDSLDQEIARLEKRRAAPAATAAEDRLGSTKAELDYYQNRRLTKDPGREKELAEEIRRLTEELRRLRENGSGTPTVQQQSFNDGGNVGGGSLIRKAAWGGFGGSGVGGGIPSYGSPGSASIGGGGSGASGGGGGTPSGPDLGDGIRGRPFGSKGPVAGKKGPTGIPYDATDLKGALGINDAQWGAYREGLTDIEGKRYEQVGGAGGRFSGRYQFGPSEIAQTARQLGEAPPSRAQFLGDKAMQERFMERYTLEHHKFLERNSAAYRDMSPEKKLEILGYAHNQGAGRGRGRTVGALGYLESGRVGHDGFGTAGTRYFGTIRKRLAEIQELGKGAGAVASAGPLAGSTGPLSAPQPEAPEAEGAPEPTDGRGVNADLIKVLKRAQQLSKVKFHIHEGLRTLERQREMVRRGWSKTMDSEHLKGRAVDVRADGDPAVGALDRKKYEEINRAMRQASEEAGIPVEWGGDWKKFKDVPHFQFPKGYRAGPNAYAGDAPPGKARAEDNPAGKATGPGGSKNGTLHIKIDGPPGTQVRHDMGDLFGDTTVSHGKSQMSMARA